MQGLESVLCANVFALTVALQGRQYRRPCAVAEAQLGCPLAWAAAVRAQGGNTAAALPWGASRSTGLCWLDGPAAKRWRGEELLALVTLMELHVCTAHEQRHGKNGRLGLGSNGAGGEGAQ